LMLISLTDMTAKTCRIEAKKQIKTMKSLACLVVFGQVFQSDDL